MDRRLGDTPYDASLLGCAVSHRLLGDGPPCFAGLLGRYVSGGKPAFDYIRSLNTSTVPVQDDPDLAGQIDITLSHIVGADSHW